MQVVSERKLFGVFLGVALVVGAFLVLLTNSSEDSEKTIQSEQTERAELRRDHRRASSVAAHHTVVIADKSSKETARSTSATQKQIREVKIRSRLLIANERIATLQRLLSADGDRTEVYNYIELLLKSGIAVERQAAVQALEWLGGARAADLLIPLLDDDMKLRDQVDSVLRHLIEESLYSQKAIMDNEAWLEVMKLAGNSSSKHSYMTLLSAFPEIDSVPVILEMFKSENSADHKLANDFMSFISGGVEIAGEKEAQAWWQQWLANRNITADDLKKYEAAKKEAHDRLSETLESGNEQLTMPPGVDNHVVPGQSKVEE